MSQCFIIFHACRQNGNLWLNGTTLKSIRGEGKVTSLTIYPAVENKLTLMYGGSILAWTLTITPSKHASVYLFKYFTN